MAVVSIAAPKPHIDILLPSFHKMLQFGILLISSNIGASRSLIYSVIRDKLVGLSPYPGPKKVAQ